MGIGDVLIQEGHPLAYMSKALSGKHHCMLVYEKEMLVAVTAV